MLASGLGPCFTKRSQEIIGYQSIGPLIQIHVMNGLLGTYSGASISFSGQFTSRVIPIVLRCIVTCPLSTKYNSSHCSHVAIKQSAVFVLEFILICLHHCQVVSHDSNEVHHISHIYCINGLLSYIEKCWHIASLVGTRLSVVEQRDDPGYAGNPCRKHAGCFVLESSK